MTSLSDTPTGAAPPTAPSTTSDALPATAPRPRRHAASHPLKHFRPYRVLRIVIAVSRILPRYLWLLARGRGPQPPDQAAWDAVHGAAARELARIALALEGAFVKAAQIGGARADVLPAPFIDELSQFHDAVPPRPFSALLPIVQRDLGDRFEQEVAHVEPEALAAASLAQVHRATLSDGSAVVIKIQYPEIRRLMPLDLLMLRRVVGLVQRIQRRIDLRSLVEEVARFIELELDFEREVDSTERVGALLAGDPDVVVPDVVRSLCGPNTIVLEYIDGIQVARTAALEAAGHQRADVARRIGDLYGRMIFRLGFFHGDPHPGNLLVLADGRIGLLDYGLCKELPKGFPRLVAEMMIAALVGDSETAFEAASQLGFQTGAMRPDHLRSLLLMMIGDSDSDDGLIDILSQSEITVIPSDFALVLRTLVLLNGLSHRLTPGRRLIQGELIQHLAAGAEES